MGTISQTTQKARKEHKCDWCCEKINIGEMYERQFVKGDGVLTWKNHTHCAEIAEKLKMFDNCDEGLSTDEFLESIRCEYSDLMIQNHKEVFESKDFVRPLFKVQLDYVLEFHNIKK